ncbi:hypothetical protein DYD21_15085 [Rhodohalobacter sp. SW132]|uniref:capsule assembly Wzi family protein n=1 Tax=Rhodohalobacter sp. SW132 TaxID=2293433 RepID=UPI000E243D5C|nr:capsule assembly Wzi family protein [Rhodohalobacter sp. SW132]REL29174.1 hypothetical protein DYD21_15085 [Rhodohalobacter sp. SW132]
MMYSKKDTFIFFVLLFLAGFLLTPIHSNAQLSLPELSFETTIIANSNDTTPFWIQSNRHGIFAPNGSQVLTRLQAHSTNNQLTNQLTLSYGVDFIARPGKQSTNNFNQGYLQLEGYGVYLQAGRFNYSSPITDVELGMGSLGVSGNASPIPQIRAGFSDWTSLPFTQDFIQIKGHMAHGWLGSRRLTENLLYHEKVGHARFGGSIPLNLYGGMAHYAKWGGTHPRFGELPSTFEDFFRVAIAIGGDENAPPGERDYMLGDHLGAWDFGFFLEFNNLDVKGYRQFPLETKDNLKLKSPQDALTGILLEFDNEFILPISKLVYEYMYTKWQDGPRVVNEVDGVPCNELPSGTCRDMSQGNENYYNHGIYQTGWAYNRRTIGNPIFTLRDDNLGIDNNRIVAHHIGLQSVIGSTTLHGKLTYSRNFGTRSDPFESQRNQYSTIVGAERVFQFNGPPLTISTEIAYDRGSLIGTQFGVVLGIKWVM